MRFTCTVLYALVALSLSAQPAVVRTIGQYDADGTILYSVYVATETQKLEGVAVGGTVPIGVRFIENVDIPAGVVFEGVRDNVAVWSLPEIPADRLIGPFTFRGKPDNSAAPIAEPAAAVSYRLPEPGIVEYSGTDKVLPVLESKGSVIFDERGTLDDKGRNAPVQIGRTGVMLFVPEGAVRTQTTVSVEREAIDNNRLPAQETPLWWCGLYRVSISPQEQSAKSFGFGFPNRRELTPGLPVTAVSNDTGAWSKSENKAIAFGQFGGGGLTCITQFGHTVCSGTPAPCFNCNFGGGAFNQFGFGVLSSDRLRSTVNSTQLSTATNTPTTPVTAIKDGSSNTIIAVLTGLR